MRLRRRRHIFSEASEVARSRRGNWWWYVLFLLISLSVIGSGYFYYFSKEIKNRFASRKWSVPARVFSATTPLYPGQSLSIATLEQMLVTRSYRPSSVWRWPAVR